MKWKCGLAGLMLGAVVSTQAWADGRSAAHNFFTNLARAGSSIGVTEANTMVSPTLVRGIYALTDQRGALVALVNEGGNLFGDSRGFNILPPNGGRPRPMALDEAADLRAEVLASIDFDKLPKAVHGDGGNRQILLFSAVDCEYCKGMEDAMRSFKSQVNTTFYVVPSSLQPIGSGGLPAWQAVSKIWCAEDAGAAWVNFWATRNIPNPRQCRFADPRTASTAVQYLRDVFQAVGLRVLGSPQFIREDGVIIRNKTPMDVQYAAKTFGPAGKPPARTGLASRWLAMGGDVEFQAQPLGGQGATYGANQYQQQPYQQQQQQQKKFNVNDALNLKKLFK